MPPDPRPDSFTVRAGRQTDLDVLANDEAGQAKLRRSSLRVVVPPAHAAIVSIRKHAIAYRPAEGFLGSDGLDYQVCDVFGQCATAHVNITVA